MFLTVTGIPQDVEIQKHLTSLRIGEWIRDDVFSLRWWALLVLISVALFVWWKMADKSRLDEICLYAALATIIILGIVEYGEELTLWNYPTDIIPIFPPLTSINLISLPFIYSLIYQHYKTWRRFIWAVLIVTAAICFIIEPILAWGGFYQLIKWKYYYSFPVYAILAICIRAVVIKINSIAEKTKNKG